MRASLSFSVDDLFQPVQLTGLLWVLFVSGYSQPTTHCVERMNEVGKIFTQFLEQFEGEVQYFCRVNL